MNDVKAALIDSEGRVQGVRFLVEPGQYTDGEIQGDLTVRLVPVRVTDVELVEESYWDFESERFRKYPPRPTEFHFWSGGAWRLDEKYKRRWLSQAVNPVRDRLEAAPVRVDGYLIDIDERAEKRMADALGLWSELGFQGIPWVLADNSELIITKPQLQRFYDEGRRLRAIRSLQLHAESRALKNDLSTSPADIDAWEAGYSQA